MKNCIICLLLVCFTFGVFGLANAEEKENTGQVCVFELTDGYFQRRDRKPYHLLDGLKKQSLRLGDKFKLWVDFKILGQSPCGDRLEVPCVALFEIVDSLSKVRIFWKWDNRRLSDDGGFSFFVPGQISRKTAFGEGIIRVRFLKEKEELYSYEIPIEILE